MGVEDDEAADAVIEAATVGEVKPYAVKVVVEEYDPRWPVRYAAEETAIRSALGDAALLIEHTGSTSVPGLAAKPLIDILLLVADSSDESSYVPALEEAGFVLRIREPDSYEHRLLIRPVGDDGDRSVNLHVYSPDTGAVEIERILAFRDWLRTNDDDRELYARTKRELATREWKYVQHYANHKSAVVEEILARALADRA